MGFYQPRVIVSDAQRHGVVVRPVHINRSEEKCVLENGDIRMGFEYVDKFGEANIGPIIEERQRGPFSSLGDFCRRTRLPRLLVENLILAGGMDEWEPDRRQMIWELGRLRYQADELPLIMPPSGVELDPMSLEESLVSEYGVTGVSTHGHLMDLYRDKLTKSGIVTSEDLDYIEPGTRVRVAGMIVIRQAPPTAKGFVFLTLEDEWGLINIIVRPDKFEVQREIWRQSFVLIVEGVVQRVREHINVQADRGWRIR